MTTAQYVGIGIAVLFCYVISLILRGLRNARDASKVYDTAATTAAAAKNLHPPLVEPDFSEFPCGHPRRAGPHLARIRGQEMIVEFGDEMPLCVHCAEKWLEKNSAVCSACSGPICPAMPIATAPASGQQPYVHLEPTCFKNHAGARFGIWGQGRAHWHEEPATEKPS